VVRFATDRRNVIGLDDKKNEVIDSDIFSGKTIVPAQYFEWESYCR
jgi:hypothetical protein